MKFACPIATVVALLALACRGPETSDVRPGDPAPRRGDEISACGSLFHTGTRVILWNDPGGYDAYRAHRHFQPDVVSPRHEPDRITRFGRSRGSLPPERAAEVEAGGWTLDLLGEAVSQVVIHYDACGTSRRCFEVLHDIRGLSCHFLVDVDGTIYQTLDLKERAWHAAEANDRSIGIEIAGIGAFDDPQDNVFTQWYARNEEGEVLLILPPGTEGGGLPTNFVSRPARSELIAGAIHGKECHQYDFTEEQYLALDRLLTALCRIFPRIAPDCPRDAQGKVLLTTLPTPEERLGFEGIVAHWHLTEGKRDPGPAFDWDRLLGSVQSNLKR